MKNHRIYRALTHLYPRDFGDHYRDDLVQHHADLFAQRGPAAAWARTGLDLLVTVPRYQLETIMSKRQSTVTLSAIIILIAVAGAASFVVGFYPGVALIAVAALIAITQRSALAQALDSSNGDHRRRNRFMTAAVLAAVFGVLVADALNTTDWGDKAIVYNLIGTPAFIGAIGFFVAGLVTRTGPPEHANHTTAT